MDPINVQQVIAAGCLEIMIYGTRNARRQREVPSGLRFNIYNLETSHQKNRRISYEAHEMMVPEHFEWTDSEHDERTGLENDRTTQLDERIARNISSELLYSSLYWVKHLKKYTTALEGTGTDVSREAATLTFSQMLVDVLETERSLFWLEVLSLTRKIHLVGDMLTELYKHSYLPVSLCASLVSTNANKDRFHRHLVRSYSSCAKCAIS